MPFLASRIGISLLSLGLASCAGISPDIAQLERELSVQNELTELAQHNLRTTQRTAWLRVNATQVRQTINADDGRGGYIEYLVSAQVLEDFVGAESAELQYLEWAEAWFDPSALIGTEQVVSLCSNSAGQWITPDAGFALPAEQINLARLRGIPSESATACSKNDP